MADSHHNKPMGLQIIYGNQLDPKQDVIPVSNYSSSYGRQPSQYSVKSQPTIKQDSVSDSSYPPSFGRQSPQYPVQNQLSMKRDVTTDSNYPPAYGRLPPQQIYGPDSISGPELVSPRREVPTFLPPQQVKVHFEQVSLRVDDHQHAVKAVVGSAHNTRNLSNVLGTYLEQKRINEGISSGVFGPYSKSRMEVQMYNHLMHKLESLSASVLSKHKNLHDV